MDPTLINFLAGMFHVILLIVIIAALETLNIKTASLITVIGTAGLAIGLAQGSLSNFAAGVILIIFVLLR